MVLMDKALTHLANLTSDKVGFKASRQKHATKRTGHRPQRQSFPVTEPWHSKGKRLSSTPKRGTR